MTIMVGKSERILPGMFACMLVCVSSPGGTVAAA